MPLRRLHLGVLFYATLCAPLFAADTHSGLVSRFSYLDTENGLSGDLVVAMAQDADGFVWIGTDGGLDRYDGSRVQNFNDRLSATVDDSQLLVSNLLDDGRGQLWVATWGGGLFRYTPATDQVLHFSTALDAPRRLQSDYVDALALLPDGRIAVGTQAGVDLLKPAGDGVERLPVAGHDVGEAFELRVRHLFTDSSGTLWVATRAGLFVVSGGEIRRHPLADRYPLLHENIYTVVEDGKEAVLLGTQDGLWRLTENVLARYVLAGQPADRLQGVRTTSLVRLRNGDLVVGTLERGAYLEQRHENVTRVMSQQLPAPHGIPDNEVASLLETADGTVWIGTISRGVARTTALSLALEHYLAVPGNGGGLADNRITDLTVKNGVVWIVTEAGISTFDPIHRRITNLSTIDGWTLPGSLNDLKQLQPAAIGGFWLLGDYGLFHLDPARRRVEPQRLLLSDGSPLHGFVTDLVEDGEDVVVSLYDSRLVRWNPRSGKSTLYPIADPDGGKPPFLIALVKHPRHGVVARTDRGFLSIDANGAARWLRKFDISTINSLVLDGDDSYWWLGTSDVRRYSFDGELLETLEPPHSAHPVSDIVRDPVGRVWMMLPRNVTVRDATGDDRHLGAADGLQGNRVTAIKFLPGDRVVLGGPNGLNAFDYGSLATRMRPAPLRLTSIEIFTASGERSVLSPFSEKVVLTPDQEHVRVRFALLDFTDARRNRYEYRVTGSNEQWTPIDNTDRMMLQEVEPGEFTLEIRAFGPSGIPSANSIALAIESQPHWYESMPARLAYIIAALCPFALLAWLAVRYVRTNTYLDAEIQRRRVLEAMYQLATALTEGETESDVAQRFLERLRALVSFEQGALYFRKGETLLFAGAVDDDSNQRQWLEVLPVDKPRLVSRISFNDGPLSLLATDIDTTGTAAAPHWLGVPGSSRDGAVAILLLGRTPAWSTEEQQLVGAVFRQVMHGLDLSTLHAPSQSRPHRDESSGLLNRDAFLTSATHVMKSTIAKGDVIRLIVLGVDVPSETPNNVPDGDAAARVMLARIGQRILAHTSAGDVAGHVENLRFALLLPGCSADRAAAAATRLRISIEGVDWADSGTCLAVRVCARGLDGQRPLADQLADALREVA